MTDDIAAMEPAPAAPAEPVERFRLAHLSDPHLALLTRPRKRELVSKRIVGYVNWKRGRGSTHKAEALTKLIDDLKRQAPDHVAVTGDLLNLALRSELPPALAWLETLGPPGWVSLVPGNHDTYVPGALNRAEAMWDAYMTGDGVNALPGGLDRAHANAPSAARRVAGPTPRFPYVRRRGPIALVGVSSAVATAPFMATGRVGRHQRRRLASLLTSLGEEGLFRVVMVHHPPLPGTAKTYRRLTDAAETTRVLRDHGAELVLHGHNHTATIHWLDRADGVVCPVVGVPSASTAVTSGEKKAATYNLYDISRDGADWAVSVSQRGLTKSGTFETIDESALRHTA